MYTQPTTRPPYLRLTDNAPLMIGTLLIIDSLHFVFARLLHPHLPAAAGAFYVLAVATVEVAFIARWQGQFRWSIFRQHQWFFLAIGFLVGISTNLNYLAVSYIDPGTASMLAKTSVLFGLGFGIVWLRERLNVWESIGAVLAIAGVFTITFQPGDYLRLGSLLVLVSTFMYALHAALVKRYGEQIDFWAFFLFRLISTTGVLFILVLGQHSLVWPDGRTWIILLVAGTVDVVISRALYYSVLRRLKISIHTLILTLSPVVTVGWSFLLFDSVPTLQELVGGLAVIAGILIISISQVRTPQPI